MCLLLLSFSPTDLCAKKMYYYLKDGKKIPIKKKGKRVRIYKINKDDPERIQKVFVKELIIDGTNAKIIAQKQSSQDILDTKEDDGHFSARLVFRGFKSNLSDKYSTKNVSPPALIQIGDQSVQTDGKNYVLKTDENRYAYGLFLAYKSGVHMFELGGIIDDEQKDLEAGYKMYFDFLSSNRSIIMFWGLFGGVSYEDVDFGNPDSVTASTSLGLGLGWRHIAIEPAIFYKGKFYEQTTSRYYDTKKRDHQFGLELSLRYIF